MKKNFKSGFTLSELLVVVAIVAILALISIPIFAESLENSKENTDIGNMRSAKSIATTQYLSGYDLDGNVLTEEGVEYYFDASSGCLTKVLPEGYGEGTGSDGGCETFTMSTSDANNAVTIYTSESDVEGKVIKVYINSLGKISLSWVAGNDYKGNDSSGDSSSKTGSGSATGGTSSSGTSSSSQTPTEVSTETSIETSTETEAPSETEPEYVELTLDSTNISWTGYTSSMISFNLPGTFTYEGVNYKVVSTGNVFMGTKLKSITLPNTLKIVGSFKDSSITSITIPESVETINAGAFWGCTNLQTATLKCKNLTTLMNNTFKQCTALTTVTFDDSITSISKDMFWGCTSLTTIYAPYNLNKIGNAVSSFCYDNKCLNAIYWRNRRYSTKNEFFNAFKSATS